MPIRVMTIGEGFDATIVAQALTLAAAILAHPDAVSRPINRPLRRLDGPNDRGTGYATETDLGEVQVFHRDVPTAEHSIETTVTTTTGSVLIRTPPPRVLKALRDRPRMIRHLSALGLATGRARRLDDDASARRVATFDALCELAAIDASRLRQGPAATITIDCPGPFEPSSRPIDRRPRTALKISGTSASGAMLGRMTLPTEALTLSPAFARACRRIVGPVVTLGVSTIDGTVVHDLRPLRAYVTTETRDPMAVLRSEAAGKLGSERPQFAEWRPIRP